MCIVLLPAIFHAIAKVAVISKRMKAFFINLQACHFKYFIGNLYEDRDNFNVPFAVSSVLWRKCYILIRRTKPKDQPHAYNS